MVHRLQVELDDLVPPIHESFPSHLGAEYQEECYDVLKYVTIIHVYFQSFYLFIHSYIYFLKYSQPTLMVQVLTASPARLVALHI